MRPARDLARLDPVARHKLRIKAKKLRYAAQFFAAVSGVADCEQLKCFLVCLDKLQSALGDLNDEEATRGVAEAEIGLWRSAAGCIEATSPAGPERPVAPIGDHAKNLGKAIKAYAKLLRTDPF